MTDRTVVFGIALAFACVGACFSLYLIPQYKQSQSLDKIARNLDSINQAMRMQTAQHSWLVSHYMKPVRPIYPWEKHRCEWCGQEKRDGDE